MEVSDFLPTFIDFDKDTEVILGPELVEKTSLYHKKEFNDYRLEKIENSPSRPGQYMNHQTIISRFLSSNTPYNGLLVMHEPGTGKTCLSVAMIEKIKKESTIFRGALIIMKGKTLIANYKRELVDKCTDNLYKIEGDMEDDEVELFGYDEEEGNLTKNKIKRRINKKLSSFYHFYTFETFSKQLGIMSDKDIIKYYSNMIIVIDEAHHLRIGDDKEIRAQYSNLHRLVHLVQNKKILLMTGTPMIDSPNEIASLMNLILDEKDQLPVGKEFEKEYMIEKDDKMIMNPKKIEQFKEKLHGKVSFLKSMQSSVQREYVGTKIDLNYFNQYGLELLDFQREYYLNALKEDREGKGIYTHCREASLFIFPDGTYGSKGFSNYVTEKEKKLTMKSSFFEPYKGKTIEQKLSILATFSIKYANCIRLLLENEGNHFIYMDIAHGSGAIIFCELLKEFGFHDFKKSGKGPVYALLTSKTSSDIDSALSKFNNYKNMNGEQIKVIIGTKIISEGFTLKNVQHVHIITPHWNFSETDQAIARAFRLFSHDDLLKIKPDLVVKIYLYTILLKKEKLRHDTFLSIDRYMYKFCEDKDISIKSIEYLLKLISFDCRLTKERNTFSSSFNYSRNCEYQNCNYVCYKDENEENIDESTFYLYYSNEEMLSLIERIKELFHDKTYYNIEELILHFKVSSLLLYKTILYMIDHKIVIYQHQGIQTFLNYKDDIIYLSLFYKNQSLFDIFYTEHIPMTLYFNLDYKIHEFYDHYITQLFQKLKSEKDSKIKNKLFEKFDIFSKELILEYSLLSVKNGFKNINPIREYVIEECKDHILNVDDTTISTLLGEGNYRCLDTIWEDCKKDILKKCGKKSVKTKKDIVYEDNEYGYAGMYNDKGQFGIVTLRKDVDDKRKRKTGVNCKLSMKTYQLLKIIHELKIDPPIEIKKKSIEIVKEKLKETDIDVDQLTEKELIRMTYWSDFSKDMLCKTIEEFFKEKKIIRK
jgi:hypothetical protein